MGNPGTLDFRVGFGDLLCSTIPTTSAEFASSWLPAMCVSLQVPSNEVKPAHSCPQEVTAKVLTTCSALAMECCLIASFYLPVLLGTSLAPSQNQEGSLRLVQCSHRECTTILEHLAQEQPVYTC